MDQHPGDHHNSSLSSTEPTASSSLVGVCDDCCIDGSLLPTDGDVVSGFLTRTSGAESGDNHCTEQVDNRCEVIDRNADATDEPREQTNVDNLQVDSDVLDDSLRSVHVRSSGNDLADVSAEKVTCNSNEKLAAADEPMITAVDIYRGLHLTGSWNPLSAQHHREIGFGQAAPSQFTCQASASLGLVRRLQLHSKLDGHTGCVNALHFNDAGKAFHFHCVFICYFVFTLSLANRLFSQD